MSDDFDPDAYLQAQTGSDTTPAKSETFDPDAYLKTKVDAKTGKDIPNAAVAVPPSTPWDKARGLAEAVTHAGTGVVGGLGGGLTYLGTLAATGDPAAAKAVQEDTQNTLTYEPDTSEGKRQAKQLDAAMQYAGPKEGEVAGQATSDALARHGFPPWLAAGTGAAVNTGINAIPMVAGERAVMKEEPGARVANVPKEVIDTQSMIDKAAANSPQSMGAAASTPRIADLSPTLRQAVVKAAQETGGAVNRDALFNHADADKHGISLMEGQATRDPLQFANEQNSVHPEVIDRIEKQNGQMVDAIDNIRGDASPNTVQNNHIENGQIVVDALKAYDEPIKKDIDAKYQAARDASKTGDLQMDGSSFVSDANAALKPQSKFRHLPSTVQGILDDVSAADGKMNLDDFEAYSTQLSNEIRKAKRADDGNAAFAISKVYDALQNVKPLSDETAQAKGLFDTARNAARSRFQAREMDPAYDAAVSDTENGVKRGKDSTLADGFLDKYVLSKTAPKVSVDTMIQKLDPEAKEAVTAHTLRAIRQKAVSANGMVTPSGYNSAMQKYTPKLNSLVTPDTAESLDSLGRVITNAKVAPPGSPVNYSKSGVISNAAHGIAMDSAKEFAGHVVNAKTLGMGTPFIKNVIANNAARRALAPGAGLTRLATPPGPTP